MARARNIKPGFFTNELLGTYDPIISLLFAGLWCLADKRGILEFRPLRIKAELFPYREGLDVNGYLTVLERDAFIQMYSVDGTEYIKILNFSKHQTPHHTEKPRNYPEPQSEERKHTLTPLIDGETSVTTRSDSLIPDSLIPDSKPVDETQGCSNSPREDEIPPEPSVCDHTPTTAGLACKAMRDAGIAETNPSHPTLRALVDAGATVDEFKATAIECAGKGKAAFAYVLGTVRKRREDAALLVLHQGAMPDSTARKEKFDPVDFVNKNRKDGNEPITGTAERVA